MVVDRVRDRGVTLPELLVTIVILSVVTGAITAAFIVILRSLPGAEARADDARTLTGLTTYLPEDVASTPPDGFLLDDPAHLTLCAGDSPGIGLFRLGWSNHLRSWSVDYRLVPDEDGRTRVQRFECEPGGEPSVVNLTSPLGPVDQLTWQPGDPPVVVEPVIDESGRVVGVRVTVVAADGSSATMVATSNNPAEMLSVVTPSM
ncbi:MAG: PulJ/GspJ family protein [Ilumatobacteraceae bacterium]